MKKSTGVFDINKKEIKEDDHIKLKNGDIYIIRYGDVIILDNEAYNCNRCIGFYCEDEDGNYWHPDYLNDCEIVTSKQIKYFEELNKEEED